MLKETNVKAGKLMWQCCILKNVVERKVFVMLSLFLASANAKPIERTAFQTRGVSIELGLETLCLECKAPMRRKAESVSIKLELETLSVMMSAKP